MAEHTPRATADALLYAMLDARSVELELLDGLTDSQMLGTPRHFVEPPIWEMGHVGWFQELWVLRHPDGAPSLLPGSDRIYDSFNVSYTRRWDHEYPSRKATLDYISEVLQRSVGRLEAREPTADDAYFYTLAALHEDMHAENLTLIRQTLGYPLPTLSHFDPAWACPPVDPDWRLHDVTVPGGTFRLGAERDEPFVFDNEKWAHPVEVRPFRIASTPVTNAEFGAFVDDGGYRRREVWGRRGWDWRRRGGCQHPLFWGRGHDGRWDESPFGIVGPLEPWHPGGHVNWDEAEAVRPVRPCPAVGAQSSTAAPAATSSPVSGPWRPEGAPACRLTTSDPRPTTPRGSASTSMPTRRRSSRCSRMTSGGGSRLARVGFPPNISTTTPVPFSSSASLSFRSTISRGSRRLSSGTSPLR